MKCEAGVFDLGGVLIEVTQERALRSLAARSAVSADELRAAIYHSPLFLQVESGACDARNFFDEIREQARLDVAFEDFCSIYCDLFAPAPALIDVHARMRERGLPTYVFSNTSALHFDYLRRHYPFMARFDGYFLSYELGCVKPDARAYKAVEAGTGARPSGILYIDDRMENAEAAVRRGWQAIHHTSAASTLEALGSLGPAQVRREV
ncbi:MAG: HAD family hydrolase [Burkholderiales bacterium]